MNKAPTFGVIPIAYLRTSSPVKVHRGEDDRECGKNMTLQDRILCVQCGAAFEGKGLKCRACRSGQVSDRRVIDDIGAAYRRHLYVVKNSVPPATWIIVPIIFAVIYILTRAGCGRLSPEDFRLPAGIAVPQSPNQAPLREPRTWTKEGVRYTALARYEISARVLFALRVSADEVGAIAPFDLSVAWGRMSDTRLLRKVAFSHAGRFLGWGFQDPELMSFDVGLYLANMHLIPADQEVESLLRRLRTDSLVQLRGFLVHVQSDQVSLASSLSRKDTGPGACEVMWVDSAKLIASVVTSQLH
jgi:hypothetical protein